MEVLDIPIELVAPGQLLPEAVVYLDERHACSNPYLDREGRWRGFASSRNTDVSVNSEFWEAETRNIDSGLVELGLERIRQRGNLLIQGRTGILRDKQRTLLQIWEEEIAWIAAPLWLSFFYVPRMIRQANWLPFDGAWLIAAYFFLVALVFCTPKMVLSYWRIRYYQAEQDKAELRFYLLLPVLFFSLALIGELWL